MEISKTRNWFYLLTAFSAGFIMLLGAWWLFLVFKLANKLESANIPTLDGNLIPMIQWEGLTFFILLSTLSIALFYFFYQDHKKTKAIHSFFASLTHELKTPLASIRLQSEVLDELIEDSNLPEELLVKIKKYTKRLVDDSGRLESEFDKHLQLSRIERDGHLKIEEVDLTYLIKSFLSKYDQNINLISSGQEFVLANPIAISVILKNLIENSTRHNKNLERIEIQVFSKANQTYLSYTDFGEKFSGDTSSLGKLFYKHNSPKGSGIGLYLIKNLAKRMKAKFYIENDNSLNFNFIFPKVISKDD